jgi:DNA-binding protein YbaB
MNGKFETSGGVKIDPEAFNAEDIAELEVMILAASKDALINDAQQRLAGNVTGGMKFLTIGIPNCSERPLCVWKVAGYSFLHLNARK